MKRILIVDDEKEILSMLEKRLTKEGYEVIAVDNAQEAIARIKVFLPDLILLDIAMPYINGYSLAESLRLEKKLKNTPIIFMSGKELDFQGVEKKAQDFAPYDYVIKPCSFQELLVKIKEVLK